MPEAAMYVFSYKELAELLVKQQNIHEGLWGIFIRFGLGAANVGEAPGGDTLIPAAIVPVREIGIQRFEEPNNLTVDAAVVNPAPSKVTAAGKARKARKR